MRDKRPTRTVTLSDMFPTIPQWELIRSLNPHMIRYRLPLRLQIAVHQAKAERNRQA